MKQSLFLFSVLVLFTILVVQQTFTPTLTHAQQSSPCKATLLPDSSPAAWPQGKTVAVNIDPAYTSQERNALEGAFNNWKTGANLQGAVINFTFSFLTTPTVGPGSTAAYKYQVSKKTPGGGNTQGQGVTGGAGSEAGGRINAFTYLDPGLVAAGGLSLLTNVMSHEIGHTFGLDDCTTCAPGSDPMTLPQTYNDNDGQPGPSPCDLFLLQNFYSMNQGGCIQQSCVSPLTWDPDQCACSSTTPPPISPIILDIDHSGFHLTSAQDGVLFNLNAGVGNTRLKVGWTQAGSSNAFLALDRNGNGLIDDGSELFGNATPQPNNGQPKNGFFALAVYDDPSNEGNGNGLIDQGDAVYPHLRLWQDVNHDGVSQASELHTLAELGISAIALDFHESRRLDQFGNAFRYRARVFDQRGVQAGRWAWDVFPVLDLAGSTNGTTTDIVFWDVPR